jgi:hypothetical protein
LPELTREEATFKKHEATHLGRNWHQLLTITLHAEAHDNSREVHSIMGLCPALLSLMFVLLTSVLSYAGDVSATTISRTSLTATAAHAASGDIAPGTRITMQN